MSVQAITWAYQQTTSTPLAKFLLITVANYANDRLESWPSKSRLAEDMCCSESSVCKYLQTLVVEGLVELEPRFVESVQITSIIRLAASPYFKGVVRHTDHPPRDTERPEISKSRSEAYPQDGPPVRHTDTEPSVEINKKTIGRDALGRPIEGPDADVSFDGETITLVNGERADWLKRFGGDEERLDLAIIQAAGYIQPHSRQSLLKQVRAQLARAAGDKRDRDQRYAAAAQAKPAPTQAARPKSWSDDRNDKARAFLALLKPSDATQ